MRFDEIKGLYVAKRAIEIALAGKHSLLLIGEPGVGKTALAQAALGLGFEVNVHEKGEFGFFAPELDNQSANIVTMRPCPCGYRLSPEKYCDCKSRAINYYARLADWRMQIQVVIDPPTIEQILDPRPGESYEMINKRIATARERLGSNRTTRSVEPAALSILKAAHAQLRLTNASVFNFSSVARTIAALALSENISAAHMAEAISYRNRLEVVDESL